MDKDFSIEFSGFNEGQAPVAHLDDHTFIGNKGQASEMLADVISLPGFLQQSPALVDLENGNEEGAVTELIRFILDKPTASDTTYAVGTSKLFKLSSTGVASGGTPSWPQIIAAAVTNTHSQGFVRASSQYVSIADGDQKGLGLSGDFTLEGWFKITSQPSDATYELISKWDSDTPTQESYALSYDDTSGTKKIYVLIHGDTGDNLNQVSWTTSLTTGEWRHIAVTCDISEPVGTRFELYLNGISQGHGVVETADKVDAIQRSTVSFNLGAYFNGQMNNVRVWSVVRSGADIKGYKNAVLSSGYGLEGSWYSTNNRDDLTQNKNHLTPHGSPSPAYVEDVPFASYDWQMKEGESLIRLKDSLFVLYNHEAGGDIAVVPLKTEVIDPDWGSKTDSHLQKAPHPSADKEDILVFGNGRYLGVFIHGQSILDTQKLDFGEGAEVADVVFSAGMWWIAVNYGEGRRAQIYLYDGSTMSNILSDEVGIGSQKIGFLYVLNGIVYVAYEDKTSGAYAIGWISERQLKPLRYFKGTLPDHRQKTLYMNTILFASGENVLSLGSSVGSLPIQISTLADGGYDLLGGIAAPFGVPMIASSDGKGNCRLAKFSGLSTKSFWKSVCVSTARGRELGHINTVIVETKPLEENAKAEITLEANQGEKTSNVLEVSGKGKTRHVFRTINLPAIEDVRCVVSYQNGDTSANCPIRKITLEGNFAER